MLEFLLELIENNRFLAYKENTVAAKTTVFSMVREGGLEPPRPLRTLEPESSESANSTTRAYYLPVTSKPFSGTRVWIIP